MVEGDEYRADGMIVLESAFFRIGEDGGSKRKDRFLVLSYINVAFIEFVLAEFAPSFVVVRAFNLDHITEFPLAFDPCM